VSSPVVSARGLVRVYGSGTAARAVVDDVTLEVCGGEFVAIVGRSGSGKSTLLNLLGGLERPSAGTVLVAGRRLDRSSQGELARFRQRAIGFVFQFFQLIPELSAWENVLLPARLAGDLRDGRRRATELFERLDLGGRGAQLPGYLSGGEQQRVAIARALVMEPNVILADEPTGNLDAAAGAVVLDLLRAAVTADRAVVMVTHHTDHASRADRVLRMSDGRVR
jgi:putative ABC transport system ATP-binding protein